MSEPQGSCPVEYFFYPPSSHRQSRAEDLPALRDHRAPRSDHNLYVGTFNRQLYLTNML